MTTKFRSACDRCHDAKVRCSGDMPCQGCIVSKSLCFYSVSNVLGRPRGTKNKNSRRQTSFNTTREGLTDNDRPRSSTESSTQRASTRRRKIKEARSDPDACNTAVTPRSESEVPSLMNSGITTPSDDLWFLDENHSYFDYPQLPTPADFNMNCFTPLEPGTPMLSHTPPSLHNNFDPSLDVSMADFAPLDESDASLLTWEGSMFSPDTSKATADPCLVFPSPTSEATPPVPVTTPIIPTASTIKSSSSSSCSCLQQHAELLSNPTIAEMNAFGSLDDSILSLDKALLLAKQGIATWQTLIGCPTCPYSNDQEVMLLALMSIRPVTRYLQRLAPRYASATRPTSKTSEPVIADPEPTKERTRLMLGSLEVDDEERMMVYRLLFQKTVQKVRQILHSLQMLQYKQKQQLLMEASNRTTGVEDYHASSSLSHTQQITHGLATALKDLESSLATGE